MANSSASGTHGVEKAGGRAGGPTRPSTFVAQVMAEMRKVVPPTRRELITYTIVVMVFVAAIMAFVFGLDQVYRQVVSFVFGS
ncbi:preprotein translocase subunit SecE [Ornithinicoccus hortensis]|uniref:Protein translocase subunit SecE n=1 Tax=Ornithinicoccus hortensis TaxID=82346 RepID=A0A542YPM3_9MICO|nr:preprotein translocase subunit SecE [Ornithinicoccus hortensis]TQL49997.1 preprotein translocase SecE subunit [Ornithinicoccus hortensis]